MELVLLGGVIGFVVRSVILVSRLLGPPPRI
jgi:hypothetical protein